ncbi:hypothetical protein PHMEG_00021830 [Phytophthora megakarya]|uniref:Uncharacterized protein n=1 Tax=Phytophthora megakarya TaxID=4795 RepID=A0A225VK82_9STRA|nr:hypothetical protein PHMEG_00021830 [Phytophthora megakarya]
MHANTAAAHGGWAMQTVGGPAVMGQLYIHRQDITSTRCKIHGLLAGMVLYGDSGEQICDNKSVITILGKARVHANGTMLLIKYRDGNKVVEQSYVQSYKKHEYTADILLRRQRQALAYVDSYAKASHSQVMVESYSTWIDFDHYLLLDDELRPVVGNTPQYLYDRAQADFRRGWIEKQSQKPPSRHTMTTDEVPMTNTEEWTDALRRFYWRARMNILHTNSVKHNFDQRWPETCLLCDSGDRDTQDHRFGLEQPCPEVVQLESMLTDLYYRLDQQYFLPEQSIMLPSLGHDAAKRVDAPTRNEEVVVSG